jgi:hypothetical protein
MMPLNILSTIISLNIPIPMYIIHREIIKLDLPARFLEPYSLSCLMKIGMTKMNTYPYITTKCGCNSLVPVH